MPSLKVYQVFISHAWDYNAEYYRLIEYLKQAPLLKWRNFSVPEHDPLKTRSNKKLAESLANQIKRCHILIVLSGMYVAHRQWINFEIKIARDMNIPIIGIRPRGSKKIPSGVSQNAKEIVGWNTSSIVKAIRKWSR